jgi:hypothetical protein
MLLDGTFIKPLDTVYYNFQELSQHWIIVCKLLSLRQLECIVLILLTLSVYIKELFTALDHCGQASPSALAGILINPLTLSVYFQKLISALVHCVQASPGALAGLLLKSSDTVGLLSGAFLSTGSSWASISGCCYLIPFEIS